VGWALVFLSCLIVWLLVRSPWGRVLKGIREDEDAVRSLGKNVYLYKMQALVIGGLFGAIGGIIYAVGNEAVSPDFFGTDTTFFAYAILILGGAARVFGPVLGTVIFWAIIQGTDVFLRSAIDIGVPVLSLMTGTQAAVVRFMLVGLGIMLLMIFRPQGILGDRRELALDAR
jgi:branched-chain amino acid transport system permease protein